MDICACFVDVSTDEIDETGRQSNRDIYKCPAWINFRLDIGAVLNAMFPASSSVR